MQISWQVQYLVQHLVEPGARQTKQLERQGRLISSKTTFGIAIVKIYTLYAYN